MPPHYELILFLLLSHFCLQAGLPFTRMAQVSWCMVVGGLGVCSDSGLRFSSPLAVQDPQTNIRTGLWAALWALERHRLGVREGFFTNCTMVYLGVMGETRGGSAMVGVMRMGRFPTSTTGLKSSLCGATLWVKFVGLRCRHTVVCRSMKRQIASPMRVD